MMNNYKEFFECKIIDGDVPHSKQMQIKQIKSFDFSQAQLENPILNAAIETLDKQIYKKIGIEYDAMILKDALRKAKIYDNLSNELGCPLEVVSKAIEDGIVIIGDLEENGDMTLWLDKKPLIILIGEKRDFEEPRLIKYNEWCFTCESGSYSGCVALKDYGKTWWLKSDKENE